MEKEEIPALFATHLKITYHQVVFKISFFIVYNKIIKIKNVSFFFIQYGRGETQH